MKRTDQMLGERGKERGEKEDGKRWKTKLVPLNRSELGSTSLRP